MASSVTSQILALQLISYNSCVNVSYVESLPDISDSKLAFFLDRSDRLTIQLVQVINNISSTPNTLSSPIIAGIDTVKNKGNKKGIDSSVKKTKNGAHS